MFATLAAAIFSGAAFFSILVIVHMVRGYLPLMEAALRREPIPSVVPFKAYVVRRRRTAPAVAQARIERARAAA